jgi:hypothetical protein
VPAPIPGHCLLSSPRHDRLDPPKHLSADIMTGLQASRDVTGCGLAPSSETFDAPLGGRSYDRSLGPATGRIGAYPGGTFTR